MSDEQELEHIKEDITKIKETLYLRENPPAIVTQVATLSLNHDHLKDSLHELEKSVSGLEQKIDKLTQKVTASTAQTAVIVGLISLVVPVILRFVFKV